jgi:hypothetical protein
VRGIVTQSPRHSDRSRGGEAGVAVSILFKLPFVGMGLLTLGIGLYLVRTGQRQRRKKAKIASTETTQIRNLGPGTVEVKGAAHPTDDGSVLRSPIARADALATYVSVERYSSGGGGETGGGGSWKTIYEDTQSVPMLVDDGTGEIRVELPEDGALNVERDRTRVGGGDEPPERIRRFVEREEAVDEATRHDLGLLSTGERRRYSEGMIEPGEDVYVLGRATETAGWDGQGYVIDEPTASGEFVLSDKSEEQLVREAKWSGALLLAIGVIAAGVGGVITLAGLLI